MSADGLAQAGARLEKRKADVTAANCGVWTQQHQTDTLLQPHRSIGTAGDLVACPLSPAEERPTNALPSAPDQRRGILSAPRLIVTTVTLHNQSVTCPTLATRPMVLSALGRVVVRPDQHVPRIRGESFAVCSHLTRVSIRKVDEGCGRGWSMRQRPSTCIKTPQHALLWSWRHRMIRMRRHITAAALLCFALATITYRPDTARATPQV